MITTAPCPAGSFSISSGRLACALCSPSYYQPDEGQTDCLSCPAGSTSFAGAAQCSFASAPVPSPVPAPAPNGESVSASEVPASTSLHAWQIVLIVLPCIAVIGIVIAIKVKAKRSKAECQKSWLTFVGDREIEARKFVAAAWSAALGPVVHVELNPELDRDCAALQRFKTPWSNRSHQLNATDFGYMWHGTSAHSIQSICKMGFDPAQRRNQAHGPGEYFGRDADTSDGYCGAADCDGFKRLIVAIVLHGPQTTLANAHIAVVKNPTDFSVSYALPLLVVTYGRARPASNFVSAFQNGNSCTRVLYHQTTQAFAAKIIKDGFNVSRGSKLLAGEGVYFSSHPRSTHQKANHKGAILRATVSVGLSMPLPFNGHQGLHLQAIAAQGFSSARIARNDWNHIGTENGAEYVVYDTSQIKCCALLSPQQYQDTLALT